MRVSIIFRANLHRGYTQQILSSIERVRARAERVITCFLKKINRIGYKLFFVLT